MDWNQISKLISMAGMVSRGQRLQPLGPVMDNEQEAQMRLRAALERRAVEEEAIRLARAEQERVLALQEEAQRAQVTQASPLADLGTIIAQTVKATLEASAKPKKETAPTPPGVGTAAPLAITPPTSTPPVGTNMAVRGPFGNVGTGTSLNLGTNNADRPPAGQAFGPSLTGGGSLAAKRFDYTPYLGKTIMQIYGENPGGTPVGFDWAEWAKLTNWHGGKDPTRYAADGRDTWSDFGGHSGFGLGLGQ